MKFRSGLISLTEPAWKNLGTLHGVPDAMVAWLGDPGSLTTRLVNACHPGCFSVEVIRQNWARPLATEKNLLGMRRGEVAFTREVLLHCDDAPQVFARTLIPASSFSGKARRLAHLRTKPLGASRKIHRFFAQAPRALIVCF